jgi:hypothetical protein
MSEIRRGVGNLYAKIELELSPHGDECGAPHEKNATRRELVSARE